jgi:hypothetical protein
MASQTHDRGGQEDTTAGSVILMVTSFVAALLVIGGLIYATGASARHMAALTAAGCEPSLYISSLPCTTQPMLVSQYDAIVPPATKLLNADTAAYDANETHNLVAAEAALTSEATTEQALDNSLAAVTFTPQNRATALALITNAVSNSNPVPLAAVTFTPQITVVVNALIQADQALAKLTAEQARSTSLAELRSLNGKVQAATVAAQTELALVRKALNVPPSAS